MNLKTTRVDVWAAEIDDRPNGLALTLGAVADHGTDLDCVIARRDQGKPGKGTLFVSPHSEAHSLADAELGFRRAVDLHTLKIEGLNEVGAVALIGKAIGDAGVNMHGLSGFAEGHHFVCYASFDSAQDLLHAEKALEKLSTPSPWAFWRRHHETTVA